MKLLTYALTICVLMVLLITPAMAQTVPTPDLSLTSPTPSQSQAETSQTNKTTEATGILTYMVSFLQGIDKFASGGLVFTTPDVFGDTITLPGGGQIPGFNAYRTVFTTISISIIAIMLAVIGAGVLFEEGSVQVKPLLVRLFFVGIMLVGTVPLLSLTIQGTNALNNQILLLGSQNSASLDFGQLAVNIFTDIGKQIGSGADPAGFGLPTAQISLFGNAIASTGLLLFQLFVFLLTILFFLAGFLFVLFQFVIRFVSLLFLSIVYPFVIPFALSDKTRGIVKAYFMAWVGFLIHQPAFILAYMIVLSMFNALLTQKGASLGMIFLYSGSLFFLGGINALVNRIFGEPWTAMGTSIQTSFATAGAAGLLEPVARFKQGMLGGGVSGFQNLAGRGFAKHIGFLSQDGKQVNTPWSKPQLDSKTQDTTASSPSGSDSRQQSDSSKPFGSNARSTSFTPDLSSEMRQKGVGLDVLDRKKGTVAIKPTKGFSYKDSKTGLTTTYLSHQDGLNDGRKAYELHPATIQGTYADYSAFYKTGVKNPYNSIATAMKKKTGATGESHAKFTSSEDWMNSHIDLVQEKFQEENIKGVIGKRWGNHSGKSKDRIIRIYSKE